MTKSKTRQATHADGLFSGAGEHAAHPEDLMLKKKIKNDFWVKNQRIFVQNHQNHTNFDDFSKFS